MELNRRGFLKMIGATTGSLMLGAPVSFSRPDATRHLRIVCIGAHPDDPESGCGGTLARYAASGHIVTVVYLTRGERGIRDSAPAATAKIRTAEAERACKILKATPLFFGQIDAETSVTKEAAEKMKGLLRRETPNLVFAHWPIDTHMDHQVASVLTMRACMELEPAPQLYFFEVNAGSQSQGFEPNAYVNISNYIEQKKAALFAHKSQDGEEIWREHHEPMAKWRGREIGVAAAEAFVHLNHGPKSTLPGLEG
jgi:LmbE family N-acetylglucosaminyl deacetylase